MKKNVWSDTAIGIGGLFVLGIIIIFIFPWLNFWIYYLGGWIAKVLIGKYIVQGFAIFGITIDITQIPFIAGFLGWFGGFFRGIIKIKES